VTDPDAVLNRIDEALDGADEDWTVSGDAMRWAPPDGDPHEPCTCTVAEPCDQHCMEPSESLAAELASLGEAFNGFVDRLAQPFNDLTRAINASLELERRLDTLAAIVPDQNERDLYWAAAGGDLDQAIELAQSGFKPEAPQPIPSQPAWSEPAFPRIGLRIVHDRPATGGPVRGPGFRTQGTSDSIPAILSPGEAMLPGPGGPIHIRGAYGNQPMEVTQVDLDDIEGDDQ
jgi:hypothetical protein